LVGEAAADQQSDSSGTPDDTDPHRAAPEDEFSKEAEEDLSRASSGGPADAQ
jgi:hypothetical protein